jgi:hypothetical protein
MGILHPQYPKPVPVNSVDHHSLGHRDRPSQQMIDDTKWALTSEFSEVFDVSGPLRTMVGPPMHIVLQEDAVPF